MGYRYVIAGAGLLATLVVLVVGAYAYDSSKDDTIADGVTVAGVDVGGLSTEQARRLVRLKAATPLEEPVEVDYKLHHFALPAERAGMRTDVAGMVDEALRKSRDGTMLGRTLRDLTGGEEDVRIPARVSYSERAVVRFVERIGRSLNRRPQDARLNFPSLTRVKERRGLRVDAADLQRQVERALMSRSSRTVEAPVRVLQPKVTRDELEDRYPRLLVIDRGAFQLKVYRHLQLARTFRIGVGQSGYDTPAGMYSIQNKQVNPAWHVPNSSWAGSLAGSVIPPGSPDNPLKARWLGIVDGAGIHGTAETWSVGQRASHGCIRMTVPDVEQLYSMVPVKTPVYIV